MPSFPLPTFNTDPNTGRTFSPSPANDSRVGGTVQYVPTFFGDEGLILPFEEAAGQTFKAGDLVILSGARVAAATSPTKSTETILGFAQNDATGVTSFRCDVRVPRPSDTFTIALIAGSTFTDGATAGTSFGLSKTEPGVWVADPAGDPVIVVLTSQQFNAQGLVATAGGRVVMKFL